MLLDHRTYSVRAGALRKQMALYEKHGLASQKRHFGEPLAWLVSETGDVNTYVHIWVYEDAADRARKREALFKDPEQFEFIGGLTWWDREFVLRPWRRPAPRRWA